ncbi:MAG: hypothetical protein CVU39_00365 [Chloroflexi bacterium HGW-Chloroflexi-10]|nr:MAG: hypothetical protein CVU39_00365 [Chloroflexi bacterium HGW-Chloroflexi-10]
MQKRNNLPALAQALIHGQKPSRSDLLLVHGAGLVFSGILLAFHASNLTILQCTILFVLAWDMAGGMVANVTRSTNDWYCVQPAWVSIVFVAFHIFQPTVVLIFFPLANPIYFLGLYLFMLAAALLVLQIRKSFIQKPLAMALLLLGILLFNQFLPGETALYWFAPVYLIKLIYGFSVNHYSAGIPEL